MYTVYDDWVKLTRLDHSYSIKIIKVNRIPDLILI